MGAIHVIKADGTTESSPADRMPPTEELRAIVGGTAEFASVSFNGKRTCMVVNDNGAIADDDQTTLPLNEKATELFHAWGKSQGRDTTKAWKVHGTVVMLDDIF